MLRKLGKEIIQKNTGPIVAFLCCFVVVVVCLFVCFLSFSPLVITSGEVALLCNHISYCGIAINLPKKIYFL